MRCRCCDICLNDYEATIKGEISNEYLDMCMKCIRESEILFVGRPELNPEETIVDKNEEEFEE